MAKILDFEEHLPHIVSELMCWHCGHRFINVRVNGTSLKDMECPECKKQGGLFNTGQDYKAD